MRASVGGDFAAEKVAMVANTENMAHNLLYRDIRDK